MRVGYCPTMKPFVDEINKKNDLESIDFGSARSVLIALNVGKIDFGIIGRVAKKSEFDGFRRRIGEGYTLVTNVKQMILNEQLPDIKIHTVVPENTVRSLFHELKDVVYHENLDGLLSEGEVRLISWDDWKDHFELLIPVDEAHNKNPKFRVPHIYSKKDDLDRIRV